MTFSFQSSAQRVAGLQLSFHHGELDPLDRARGIEALRANIGAVHAVVAAARAVGVQTVELFGGHLVAAVGKETERPQQSR